jgi:hypothetical protein
MFGDADNDYVQANDGDTLDTVSGGTGTSDTCRVNAGEANSSCETIIVP